MGWLRQICPLRTQGRLPKRNRKEYKSHRWKRTPGEQGPLNQLRQAHMNSQRQKQWAQHWLSLYWVLCVYIIAFSLLFLRDSWKCEWVGLLFLYLLPCSFSPLGSPCPILMWWVCFILLLYFDIFCYLLEASSFLMTPNKQSKRSGVKQQGMWKKLRGIEWKL